MSASVDDTSIPLLPSARKPGYEPPIEYVQFLDMGGELATLLSLKDLKLLKASAMAAKARTIAELSSLIDATGTCVVSTIMYDRDEPAHIYLRFQILDKLELSEPDG